MIRKVEATYSCRYFSLELYQTPRFLPDTWSVRCSLGGVVRRQKSLRVSRQKSVGFAQLEPESSASVWLTLWVYCEILLLSGKRLQWVPAVNVDDAAVLPGRRERRFSRKREAKGMGVTMRDLIIPSNRPLYQPRHYPVVHIKAIKDNTATRTTMRMWW